MNTAWNFRREHLRLSHRSHYVITNGGDQPNVVPSKASVWYYFRELDQEHMDQLYKIGNKLADAAAMKGSILTMPRTIRWVGRRPRPATSFQETPTTA